jgi:hypothetical protein
MTKDEILEAARLIRPHLPELLGNKAPVLDAQLAELLARAESGEDVISSIFSALNRYPTTREWFANRVHPQSRASKPEPKPDYGDHSAGNEDYGSLPGHMEPVNASKYMCPEGDFAWYCLSVAEEVPTCPIHGVDLRLV